METLTLNIPCALLITTQGQTLYQTEPCRLWHVIKTTMKSCAGWVMREGYLSRHPIEEKKIPQQKQECSLCLKILWKWNEALFFLPFHQSTVWKQKLYQVTSADKNVGWKWYNVHRDNNNSNRVVHTDVSECVIRLFVGGLMLLPLLGWCWIWLSVRDNGNQWRHLGKLGAGRSDTA